MAHQLSSLLREAIERARPKLDAISEATAASARVGWSRKEELGHLIDSASNNHQRFVRAAIDGRYEGPGYPGNAWVAIHGYAEMPWASIVALWQEYNMLLCRVIENIPEQGLLAACVIGDNEPATLQFLIEDYVAHLHHHVDHVLA